MQPWGAKHSRPRRKTAEDDRGARARCGGKGPDNFSRAGPFWERIKKKFNTNSIELLFYPDRRDKPPRFGREKPGDFTLFVRAGGTLSGKRVRTGCDAPQGKRAICPRWRLAMRRIGQRSAGRGAEYGRRMPQNAPRRRALLRRGGDKVPGPARGSGTGGRRTESRRCFAPRERAEGRRERNRRRRVVVPLRPSAVPLTRTRRRRHLIRPQPQRWRSCRRRGARGRRSPARS